MIDLIFTVWGLMGFFLWIAAFHQYRPSGVASTLTEVLAALVVLVLLVVAWPLILGIPYVAYYLKWRRGR